MKEDIHYTNLMLKLEKIEEKIERLEKILLSRSASECGNKKIGAEDFSRFLEFDQINQIKIKVED